MINIKILFPYYACTRAGEPIFSFTCALIFGAVVWHLKVRFYPIIRLNKTLETQAVSTLPNLATILTVSK